MATLTDQSTWDARIARARELASSRPAARDLLTFYASLAEYQRQLAASVGDGVTFDVDRVVEAIPGFLAWLRRTGPSDLALSVDIDRVASALRASEFIQRSTLTDSHSLPPEGGSHQSKGGSQQSKRGSHATEIPVASGFSRKAAAVAGLPAEAGSHESKSDNPAERFVIESLLQPFAEQFADGTPAAPVPGSTPMRCPRCAALPVVAVLREEGHGGRRSLLCALCLHEWECLRIVCPACGEQDFDKLPVYTAGQFAHVRINACDRCQHYTKTIDLTRDGLAVPCVDDIASVSLDLWARERGYTRIKHNVFGI